MNTVVTKMPTDVSEAAKAIYVKAVKMYSSLNVTSLTDDEMEAVRELEEVGLASIQFNRLYPARLSKAYTVARGRGAYRIDITLAESRKISSEELHIATVLGGEMELHTVDKGWEEAVIVSRHKNATDFEHDSSKVFYLKVLNPVMSRMSYGVTEFIATALEGKWYDFGVDPLTVSDDDTSSGLCDSEYCEEPHPFAPYMPPVKLKEPKIVRITMKALDKN